jgi:hypothetical protein
VSLLCKSFVAFREIFSEIPGYFRKIARRFWEKVGRFGKFMRMNFPKHRAIFEKSPKLLLRELNILECLLKVKVF